MALDATPLERFWVIAFSSWNCLSSNLSSIACNDGVIAKLAVMHSACRSCWSAQILSLLLLLGRLLVLFGTLCLSRQVPQYDVDGCKQRHTTTDYSQDDDCWIGPSFLPGLV